MSPYTNTDPELPFATGSHASWTGTQEVQPRAGSQLARLLALYQTGDFSDQAAARALGLPLATINARRAVLVQRGQVVAKGLIQGIGKARQTTWGRR